MTLQRSYAVACDRCPHVAPPAKTARGARKVARAMRWRWLPGRVDLCPACFKALPR